MRPHLLVAALLSAAPRQCGAPQTPPIASQAPLPRVAPAMEISWRDSATSLQWDAGQRVRVHCPPRGVTAAMWGTDVYAGTSSVCTAALHAGRMSQVHGGTVDVEVRPPADGYLGTLRNGVASRDLVRASSSFSFAEGPLPGLYAAPLPPAMAPVDPWTVTASPHRADPGRTFQLECPPGTPGRVWGTEVYTDDSSVCSAAVHAGRIRANQGGIVAYVILPGRPLYFGSARNDVTAADYGAHPGSFAFDATPQEPHFEAPAGALLINGVSTAVGWRGQDHPVRVYCPPHRSIGNVWGSGTYTDDSALCAAAVHAGRITLDAGGAFTVRTLPGRGAYHGTSAHGVTSLDYAAFEGSIALLP